MKIEQEFGKFKFYNSNQVPLCQRCDEIIFFETEYCETCNQDFKKKPGIIRVFFHNFFWGFLKYKYPLYWRKDLAEQVNEVKKIFKK